MSGEELWVAIGVTQIGQVVDPSRLQKSDYNTFIFKFCTKPIKKFRFFISHCRLKTYPKVRPIIDSDVKMLANEFVKGYQQGDRVLYVSPFDITDKDLAVREDDTI